MQQPRFAPSNFNMQRQIDRHRGLTFGPRWPMQHRNRQSNYFLRGTNNYQSENGEYWCETCDRGFNTLQLLENHKQQHQKCNIDGCQFIAHPKVLTKHIQMQHSTGLFKKIANINNPEEIKKWREERKNKYPTRENIEKKDAETKEKVDRGEKMGMKYNRENKWQNAELSRKRKSSHDNNHNQQFKRKFSINRNSTEFSKKKIASEIIKKPLLPQKDDTIILLKDNFQTLKPFTGILHLLDDVGSEDVLEESQNSFPIEDDEYINDECNQSTNLPTSDPVVCGALSSLICNYESSDNESTPEIETKPENAQSESKPVKPEVHIISLDNNVSNNSKKSDDEDSGPEEIKIDKDSQNKLIDISIPNTKEKKNNDIDKKMGIRGQSINVKRKTVKLKSKLPSTLLEKLLCNEIRQERNIVLQCIRYIINKKYFQNNITK